MKEPEKYITQHIFQYIWYEPLRSGYAVPISVDVPSFKEALELESFIKDKLYII